MVDSLWGHISVGGVDDMGPFKGQLSAGRLDHCDWQCGHDLCLRQGSPWPPTRVNQKIRWLISFYPVLSHAFMFFFLKGDFTFDTTIITQAWELRVNIYAWLLFHEDGMLNCWQCKMAEASKTHYAIVREVQTFLQFEKSAENHNPREKSLRGFDSCPWNLICLIWFVQFFKRFKVSIMIFSNGWSFPWVPARSSFRSLSLPTQKSSRLWLLARQCRQRKMG